MFPSWNHSRTLRTAVVADHHGFPGLQPAVVTLIRTGTADLIGKAVLKGEDPGEPGNSEVQQALYLAWVRGSLSLYPISRRGTGIFG